MKAKKFKAIITLVTIVLSVGYIGQVRAAFSNLHRASPEDFSIALYDVEREEHITTLHFAITKTSEGKADFIPHIPETKEQYKFQLLQVLITLIDDHENRYDGNLNIDLNYEYRGGFLVNYFPKGFTYVDAVKIRMPKIAPIEKVKIGDKEILFKKLKLAKPRFLKDFGDFTGIKGQKVYMGKWLSFRMGEKIIPAGTIWQLQLVIENEDYNPLSTDMIFGVQLHDGRIYWHDTSGYKKQVGALSKFSEEIGIVNAQYCGYTDEFTYPVALLVIGINESTKETSLRIFPLTPTEFPILVGQGTKEIQKIFLAAYKRNGGRKIMGDPSDPPHWSAGGDKSKDENDALVQDFPAVSGFGKSAIIWNRQVDLHKAVVLHGEMLEVYLQSGGPYGSLGSPMTDQVVIESYFKTKGSYATFEKGMGVLHQGKIYTVSGKILEKWKKKNLAKGALGFPIEEEQPVSTSGAEGSKTSGGVQKFEGGHIYHISSGKNAGWAFETYGPVDKEYQGIGAASSWLGFPTGDITKIVKRDHGDFEGGYIGSLDGVNYQVFRRNEKIVFSAFNGKHIIYTANVDGSGRTKLVLGAEPVPSPDGSKIVFQRDKKIYIMESDGSEEIFAHPDSKHFRDHYYLGFTWSPEGRKIAFGGFSKIYIMNADGSGIRYLTDGSHPSWSPDGTRIAFGGSRGDIWLINPDGSGKVNLTDTPPPLDEWGPAWSPDGAQIAFTVRAPNNLRGLYVINRDGSNRRNLRKHRLLMPFPVWSPDGKYIVYNRIIKIKKYSQAFIIRVNGSPEEIQLTDSPPTAPTTPRWWRTP